MQFMVGFVISNPEGVRDIHALVNDLDRPRVLPWDDEVSARVEPWRDQG